MVLLPSLHNLHPFFIINFNLYFRAFKKKSSPVQISTVTNILLSQLLRIPHQDNIIPACRWGHLKIHGLQPQPELQDADQSFNLESAPSSIPLHSPITFSLPSPTSHPLHPLHGWQIPLPPILQMIEIRRHPLNSLPPHQWTYWNLHLSVPPSLLYQRMSCLLCSPPSTEDESLNMCFQSHPLPSSIRGPHYMSNPS